MRTASAAALAATTRRITGFPMARAALVKGKTIKEIARDLKVSRKHGPEGICHFHRLVGCRVRDVRVGCLVCGLGLLMSLSVQQYTIGDPRRVLNGH